MKNSIRVLLIDRQLMFVYALQMLLDNQPEITVIGTASEANEAIKIARLQKPDIIVSDIFLEQDSGLDLIPQLLSTSETTRIITLTDTSDPHILQQIIKMGVMGIIHKSKTPEILISAIKKVHMGEAWIDRLTMGSILSNISRPDHKPPVSDDKLKIHLLTPKERHIICLLSKGLKNKRIAEQLHLSEITVRHHLSTIYRKLDVSDRFELIVLSYNQSLCPPPGATAE
jgi:two-component system, NarL family, nitrate/nitrite response regulator NarL